MLTAESGQLAGVDTEETLDLSLSYGRFSLSGHSMVGYQGRLRPGTDRFCVACRSAGYTADTACQCYTVGRLTVTCQHLKLRANWGSYHLCRLSYRVAGVVAWRPPRQAGR